MEKEKGGDIQGNPVPLATMLTTYMGAPDPF